MLGNIFYLFIDKFVKLVFGLYITTRIVEYLGPSSFGLLSYSLVIIYFVTPLITLGFDSILVRQFVLFPEEFKYYIYNAIVTRVILGFLVNIILFVFLKYFIQLDVQVIWFCIVLGASAFVSSINSVFDCFYQSIYKNKYTILIQLSAFLCVFIIRYVLLVFEASLIWFVLCYLFEVIIVLFLGLVFFQRRFGFTKVKWDYGIIKTLVLGGLPITGSILAIAVYTKIDQFFISEFLGIEKLGIYTAGLRISDLLFIIPTIFNTQFYPDVVSNFSSSRKHYRVVYSFSIILFFSIILAVIFYPMSNLIVSALYGSNFIESARVLKVFSLLSILNASGIFISSLLFAKNLQKWATISALIGGCFSVILNSYLIPLYGIDGVLISAVLAQVISLGSLFFLTKEARVMIVYFLSALNFVRLFIFVSRTLKRKLFYYG